jgi:hypothetical protein
VTYEQDTDDREIICAVLEKAGRKVLYQFEPDYIPPR